MRPGEINAITPDEAKMLLGDNYPTNLTESGDEYKELEDIGELIAAEQEESEEAIIERLSKQQEEQEGEEANKEESAEGETQILSNDLVKFLALEYDLNEEELVSLSKLPVKEQFNFIIGEVERKVLESNQDKFYKTQEAYWLDKYLQSGGKIESFYEQYLTQVAQLDSSLQNLDEFSDVEIITADLLNKGLSQEEIDEYIAILQEKGKLSQKAKQVRQELTESIEAYKREKFKEILSGESKRLEELERQREEAIEAEKAELASLLDRIDNIYGYRITEKDKDELFDYITETDKEGLTQLDKDLQSNENLLKVAFFLKYGSSLVQYLKTLFKEQSKKLFYDKLMNEPIVHQSKIKTQVKQETDLEKLNQF